jgi:hypothetical protein
MTAWKEMMSNCETHISYRCPAVQDATVGLAGPRARPLVGMGMLGDRRCLVYKSALVANQRRFFKIP